MENNYNGIIEDPRPLIEKLSDYVMGGETGIVSEIRFPTGMELYLPKGERQYLKNKFDTMNCTNFSSGHSIELQIIYLWKSGKLSQEAQTFFKQYLLDENDINSFRVSKRCAGILSGTTKQGNWFVKVWDTWRKVGIIPEKMLPEFSNCEVWEDYMNPNLITQEMRDIGQKSLEYIKIQYEVVQGYDATGGFSELELSKSMEALKSAPLHIGIPITAGHAIMMYQIGEINYNVLDHYEQFFRLNNSILVPVHFAFRGYVSLADKKPVITKPNYTFIMPLTYGSKGYDVKILQDILKYEGFMSSNIQSTGNFLNITAMAVKKWQVAHGLMDFANETNLKKIRFGEKSIKVVNSIYK